MPAALTERNLTDPVTQHMRTDVVRLGANQSVGEALAGVRSQPPVGRIIYFYVVDQDKRLQGVVPTRRLLLSQPEKPIADIMVKKVIAIPTSATVLDACEFFTLHKFLGFPVVDEGKRLIGVVDGNDLRHTISEAGFVDQLIIAKELAEHPPTLTPQEDLYSVVHKMVSSRHDELVVVDEGDPQKVIGMLSRSDLVGAYNRQVLAGGFARR